LKEGSSLIKWLKRNQGVGFVMTLTFSVVLVYIRLTPWASREARDGFSLGFFPSFAICFSIIFSLILVSDSRRRETPPGLANLTLKSFLVAVVTLTICGIYFALMERIGFVIITPIVFPFAMYFLGLKSWRTVIVSSVVITATLYFLFSIMGIELPPVRLPQIFPF
jgi:hypothetical protein